MKILALILARGGSKRLPGKNIRPLGGKPLINWSIDVVHGMPEISDVLVSTDDSQIAEVASLAGAMVPWLRPAELASDTATSVDAAIHAVDWYEDEYGKVDGALLLQPTSPFRTAAAVSQGIALFRSHGLAPVIGVSATHAHPMWALKITGNGCLVPFMEDHRLEMRSQDLPPAYIVNGSFYLITPNALREKRTFMLDGSVPLLQNDHMEALDIDTDWDFQLAEFMLRRGGCCNDC